MIRHYSVPVLMLHSVGAERENWPCSYLSESVSLFKEKIEYLLAKGHRFIFHDDAYHYMRNGRAIPEKAIMLTFDDGYLDNWVNVFPILKERGVKFTIYVSQEFVDPSPTCRPNLDDIKAGKIQDGQLQLLGYLCWEEMRAMEASGLVDIQSHTSTHTWQFTDGNIIDFYNPANETVYPWLYWNHYPGKKSRWVTEYIRDDLWGLPIYSNKRAMIARRYLEDEQLKERITAHVKKQGGSEFFQRPNWQEELNNLVKAYRVPAEQAPFESEDEWRERLYYELSDNKAAIEKNLKKEVRYLCWPGGAYNEELIKLAGEYGYWASTVKQGSNTIGDDPRFVHRIPSGNPSGSHRFPWKYSLFTLQFYISRFQRKYWALALDKLYRLGTA
jgi:peptidoglycan/xylan/chitin deacetylase (PgdA/CDA1 family)